MEQQEEQTPKGNNVVVDLEVSLKDLYLGNQFKVGPLAVLCSAGHAVVGLLHAVEVDPGVLYGLYL